MTEAVALTKAERFIPIVAGAALAAPTLLSYYPPMSDLPLHEAIVGILRHYGDPSYFPPDLYQLNLGQANQLFYFVALLISYAVGTIWAMKIVIALAQFLIFWTGARLADHLGRSRWSTLLLAPLALGFTYYWGLVANLLGFSAFLGALPVIDRACSSPTPRRAAAICGLLVLLFFVHASLLPVVVGFMVTLALAHPIERRATTLRLTPVAFAGLVYLVYFKVIAERAFTGARFEIPMNFTPLADRFTLVPNVLFGAHDPIARTMLFILAVLALALSIVARSKEAKEAKAATEPSEAAPSEASESAWRRRYEVVASFVRRNRFEVTAVAFVVAYFAMPFQYNGATMIYERFLGPAWALLVLCAAPSAAPPRLAKLAAAVVPIGILLTSWPQFTNADSAYRDLQKIIDRIPKNSSVCHVSLDRALTETTRIYSGAVGAGRTPADRGGRMGLSYTYGPLSPVQLRPQYRWAEYDRRTLRNGSQAMVPTHDLNRFGWVIGQSRIPADHELLRGALAPDAVLVATQGEWMLFKSTHPQWPLTSADVPPQPGMETILDRVRYLAFLRDQMQSATPPQNPAP